MDVGKLRRQFCPYKGTQIQYANRFFAGIFSRQLLTFFRSIFFRGARFFPRPSFFVAGFFRGLFLGGGARVRVRVCAWACVRARLLDGRRESQAIHRNLVKS